jgi:hypothetical protein
MTAGTHVERRVDRVRFETDRYVIVADVTLPPEGYQSRFSDSLNRVEVGFISLTNAEITPIAGGATETRSFVVVAKAHIRMAYPLDAGAEGS